MIDECSEEALKKTLSLYADRVTYIGKIVDIMYDIYRISLQDNEFQSIKVQLRALRLIELSTRNRSVKDKSTYWKLTTYGEHVMNTLMAIRR